MHAMHRAREHPVFLLLNGLHIIIPDVAVYGVAPQGWRNGEGLLEGLGRRERPVRRQRVCVG